MRSTTDRFAATYDRLPRGMVSTHPDALNPVAPGLGFLSRNGSPVRPASRYGWSGAAAEHPGGGDHV
ncbi:hypothetical protein [Streptomyces sp. NPDC040750]|uniref:hypothetical protein n=1 Tax=Streptomyces sp. NPDC040750 TaxID=3154491 RepID=UPI0033F8BACB